MGDCLVATLSVDPVKSHDEWLTDVVAHCENNIEIKFPIIGDQTREISTKYGMIDPGTSGDQSLPPTIRAVFIINPENKLMLTLNNHADFLMPDGSRTEELKGSVFLLPTVSPEEADAAYPGYHTCDVPSGKPYLRLVKQDVVSGAPAA